MVRLIMRLYYKTTKTMENIGRTQKFSEFFMKTQLQGAKNHQLQLIDQQQIFTIAINFTLLCLLQVDEPIKKQKQMKVELVLSVLVVCLQNVERKVIVIRLFLFSTQELVSYPSCVILIFAGNFSFEVTDGVLKSWRLQ